MKKVLEIIAVIGIIAAFICLIVTRMKDSSAFVGEDWV